MSAARLPGRRAARWAGRHERHRDGRARQAVLEDLGAAGLHAGDPGGPGDRSDRAERGGKTTLMHMAVGLIAPTEGRVTVLGGRAAGSPEALKRMAFVAQDVPLYQH